MNSQIEESIFQSSVDSTFQPYSIILPKKFNHNNEYRLFIALHGSGVNEKNIIEQLGNILSDLPYILIAPRGREFTDHYLGKSEQDVLDLIIHIKNTYNISKTFIYGFSMGGYGVWRFTFLHPHLFNGGIVVSGTTTKSWFQQLQQKGMMPKNIDTSFLDNPIQALHLPYLVFHGTNDPELPFKETSDIIKSLQNEGLDITFYPVENGGHGGFDISSCLLSWLEKN